ncbi:MAG: hypothetical protein LUI06_09830 [Ruminococcus sp.]|nr:hypothetical protein [Ruminococcus sp.]
MKTNLLKIAVAAVCAVQALTLTSCGQSEEDPTKLAASFSLCAKIQDDDFTATAQMTRSDEGWQIQLTSPETLEGMSICCTSTGWLIDYNELSYTIPIYELLDSSPLRLTVSALDRCVSSKASGTIYGQEYSVAFENGAPKTLTLGENLTATFTEYTQA